MKSFILKSAEAAGASDLAAVEKLVDDAALAQRSVVEDIIDSKLVNEEQFLEALAHQLDIEWEPELKPRKTRKLKEVCSAQVALKFRLLPVALGDDADEDEAGEAGGAAGDGLVSHGENGDGDEPPNAEIQALSIATYDPFNLLARQGAAQMINRPVRWKMASRTRVLQGIQKLYGVGADTFEQILAGRDLSEASMDMKEETTILDEDDDEASVVKFVNQIIREALQQRATDIHVEPLEHNLRIRYRIDGLLHDIAVPENIKALQDMVIARLKIMSRLDIAERRLPQDGRIALELDGNPIDVRVATIPTVEGESVSLRLLNQEKFNLDKLGLLPEIRSTMVGLLKMSNGIILITGPTGSGKSTSLYTFLSELNSTDTRIVTIEDPVENKLEGVMQIAVKPEIKLTFATGLRSILRGDPNIVMVGEIRDLETAEIAVRASLTGHLVFSTLHTNDAIGGISRLTDMGVEPFLVCASVRAFLAQRLVRRLCVHCRTPGDYEPAYLVQVGLPADAQVYVPAPNGCDQCSHSGFHGRLAIYEVCVLTKALQDLIVAGAGEAEIRIKAENEGFINMREYGLRKVLEGVTTIEEVVSVTTAEMRMVEQAHQVEKKTHQEEAVAG
jgi:type II secretory ATPase GspE/PulE/Tfp pilus assembly ATPase PilB-like protein